ncbi:MAG TPA: class I SAM-dependent methyltransferase [Burkholderiaceae bacterium]|nr:class I SAM-dependent methyltransferase [Burkholderiaceae bacterium]
MPDITPAHAGGAPSAWVQRWSHLVPAGASVLDVACGSGRHVRWFAARGGRVTGVDRDASATAPLAAIAEIVIADIEAGPWPFADRTFDAVVVTNYLWRERLGEIVAAVAPGGVLIYETFAIGHERFGKPSNPAFLLRPGELLQAAAVLRVVAYEDGVEAAPPRAVQRIVARRDAASDAPLPPPLGPDRAAAGGTLKSADSEDRA